MADHPDAERMHQAWGEFCERLRQAGTELLDQCPPGDELDTAEGFRYLTRLVRSALESAFETPSADSPRIEPMYAARTSIAQRNPDQIYLGARLDPRHDYRITGRRGSGGTLSFVTRAGATQGGPEGMTGFLDGSELEGTPDGRFEVSVAVAEQEGNWLPMEPTSDTLMVRELFFDPGQAEPSALDIERADGAREEPPLTADDLVNGLAQAGGMVAGILGRFGGWTRRAAEQPNRLWTMTELLGEGEILRIGGSPAIDYYLGYWALEADQALVVEVNPGPDDQWSFQLMNHWQENLKLPWSSSHLNRATARPDGDGRVRLVVAARNPGLANWIDTDAHANGVMLFRWFGPVLERPVPTVGLVALDELDPEPGGAEAAARRQHQVAPGYLAPRIG